MMSSVQFKREENSKSILETYNHMFDTMTHTQNYDVFHSDLEDITRLNTNDYISQLRRHSATRLHDLDIEMTQSKRVSESGHAESVHTKRHQ